MTMFENYQDTRERAILFAVTWGDEQGTAASLRELGALAETAGAVVVTTLMQNRAFPDPAAYLGKGKIEELAELLVLLEADTVIWTVPGTGTVTASLTRSGIWTATAFWMAVWIWTVTALLTASPTIPAHMTTAPTATVRKIGRAHV